MKNYEAYKESELDWIGTIPKEWIVTSFKNLLLKVYGGGTPNTSNESFWADDEANGIPWVAISDISKSNGTLNKTAKRITVEGLKNKGLELLPIGTLLMSIFASLGKTTRLGVEATVNQAILGLVPNNKLKVDFLEYLLVDAERYISFYSSMSTQENLNLTKIKNLKFPVPTTAEQTQIAAYLDHKTQIIDALIEKKEQLIKKLQTQRQAIINEAVTKGLNPNAKMKDSGIEWLGEIPEHWEVVKLKFLTKKIIDGAHFTPTYVEKGIPFLRVTDIQTKEIDLSKVKFIPENEHRELSKRCNPEKGDILLSKNGTIGITKVIDWDWEFSVFVSLCLIKFNERLLSRYFSHFFNSSIVDQQIKLGSKTTSVTNLHLDKIRELLIAIPNNLIEQENLCDYLDVELMKFDGIIKKSKTQIKKLKSYRQSIISEAVTGKIDVRDWQAPSKN